MEWLWYILASAAAGIGTGLAGLSAATVMVPVFIVLCPSFFSETGTYQATAIALASDILASALTAYTYARNRNIDLKKGWIMMVCILLTSIAGSYAAYKAGNVVLGNFTLFLTFFIGIRFLVKPESCGSSSISCEEKLNLKGIIISLFFGLTIGFGAGFVGTGGGMMMLVVFTSFLGMELKTAVGTSTFIMTFTALIASVSHILIHPAIILEKWDVMLVCIIIATVTSVVSARFANKVNSRTVSLVTGFVLTVAGGALLILKYRDFLGSFPLIVNTAYCLKMLVIYLIPCLAVLLPIRLFSRVPSFIFRKMLHVVAFSCITLMIMTARDWSSAACASVTIAVALYPLLCYLENFSWYSGLLVEKKPGEIKKSLLLLFLMFAAVIAVTWGLFNKPGIASSAILMWGTGDAAAALVGIPYGNHKIPNGKGKSYEGSLAMFVISTLAGIAVMLYHRLSPISALTRALIAAVFATFTELYSPTELDTVTVPAVITAVLLIIEAIF